MKNESNTVKDWQIEEAANWTEEMVAVKVQEAQAEELAIINLDCCSIAFSSECTILTPVRY
jgi:hypothetical protein